MIKKTYRVIFYQNVFGFKIFLEKNSPLGVDMTALYHISVYHCQNHPVGWFDGVTRLERGDRLYCDDAGIEVVRVTNYDCFDYPGWQKKETPRFEVLAHSLGG